MLNGATIDTGLLCDKLTKAAKAFSLLAENEHRHMRQAEERHLDLRTSLLSREICLRENAIVAMELCKKLANEIDDDIEDYIFLARKLILESRHPWIHRKKLQEEQILKIYNDRIFEPYALGLPHVIDALRQKSVAILSLPPEVQDELTFGLMAIRARASKRPAIVTVGELVDALREKAQLFETRNKTKTTLVLFRLYELGLIDGLEV